MTITRVLFRPLKKLSKLHKFRASNCVFCGFDSGIFTLTFTVNDRYLQDLSIDFSGKHPEAYISDPYVFDNSESEQQ